MTKRKLAIFIAALVCVILVAAHYRMFSPRPVIKSPYSMTYDVVRTSETNGSADASYSTTNASFSTYDNNFVFVSSILYKNEDVTERIDPEAVVELFSKIMSQRMVTGPYTGSYSANKLWEISLIRSNGPIHIILGQQSIEPGIELYYWYVSANKAYYKILDPDAVIEALNQMLEG
ncbi:PI-PLC domain-containing protein [Lachnoclostridium phytofermentans]|uniref:Uncharacterized protein n=1 Tax=Lachnoclostridium phytofermentans (strain ATCC 700394 / DSM 18823 / ISDg) TaxID=357809 RepID=A9KKB6_LACP7|nr:hypothetical protein [Lachnoclostridium phytofermentans]ABX44107.1 hypothetical protein Cphy_3760 [Lachnoclostridium phytofermentans ISDg]